MEAIGYQWKDLKIFIKSLRKVSRDRVIFIVDENLDKKTKDKLNFYDIETHHYLKNNLTNKNNYKNLKQIIAQKRYEMYEIVLNNLKNKPKKILLTDSRDVVFQ